MPKMLSMHDYYRARDPNIFFQPIYCVEACLITSTGLSLAISADNVFTGKQ